MRRETGAEDSRDVHITRVCEADTRFDTRFEGCLEGQIARRNEALAKRSFLHGTPWFRVHYACRTAGFREAKCPIGLEVKGLSVA